MSKFNKEVNKILARKIAKAKKRLKNKVDKVTPPNTPGNRPVSQVSPAMRKGINQDIADTPMPTSIGV